MTAGQKGVLRINEDRRSTILRKGRPKLGLGIYAIFEVTGSASFVADPDRRGNNLPDDGKPNWRVPVRVLKDLFSAPLLAELLPDEPSFHYIRHPLHTTTIALSKQAFETIAMLAGCPELASLQPASTVDELADSLTGIRILEQSLQSATPKQRSAISVRIERGRVGATVKHFHKGCCQICAGLGNSPVAFVTRRGLPFSEAHHVVPVSALRKGSLSHANIMVLCPNHHRQAHFGVVDIVEDMPSYWTVVVDGIELRISKLLLQDVGLHSLVERALTP
jgi:hypothetical protein